MKEQKKENKENKGNIISNTTPLQQNNSDQTSSITDNRKPSSALHTLQKMNMEKHAIGYQNKTNDAVNKPSEVVSQRAWNNMYQATYESEFYYIRAIFDRRVTDGTATTGVHNYAYDLDTGMIMRSGTSGHAEILLLSMSREPEGGEVIIISEYKPCKYCQQQIEMIEQSRGISVRVIYLLGYEEKGDGDKNLTREFYKSKGWLSGGGIYVYAVVQDE